MPGVIHEEQSDAARSRANLEFRRLLDKLPAAAYTTDAEGLITYFNCIRDSFAGVRRVSDPRALVVQMVAFSEPDWQIPRYLESMEGAGFDEVLPAALGLPVSDRLWRSVPGRRWFALIQGSLATAKEIVLFHRPKPE